MHFHADRDGTVTLAGKQRQRCCFVVKVLLGNNTSWHISCFYILPGAAAGQRDHQLWGAGTVAGQHVRPSAWWAQWAHWPHGGGAGCQGRCQSHAAGRDLCSHGTKHQPGGKEQEGEWLLLNWYCCCIGWNRDRLCFVALPHWCYGALMCFIIHEESLPVGTLNNGFVTDLSDLSVC